MQKSEDANPALRRIEPSPERWFHFAMQATPEEIRHLRLNDQVQVSDDYEGPWGTAVMVQLAVTEDDPIFIELHSSPEARVSSADSAFVRVESTANCWSSRDELVRAVSTVGITMEPRVDGFFPTLEGLNRIAVLDWHYLEFVEPTAPGVISGIVDRLGRPGIFGINVEPADMKVFIETAEASGLRTNTPLPDVLPVVAEGKEMDCADIITVNPRATGGGRIFVLTPMDYPWGLLGR